MLLPPDISMMLSGHGSSVSWVGTGSDAVRTPLQYLSGMLVPVLAVVAVRADTSSLKPSQRAHPAVSVHLADSMNVTDWYGLTPLVRGSKFDHMSQTGDVIPREEYWSVRTAYEAGLKERMAGWDGMTVPDSPVPGDVDYGPQEPEWDEFYFDPDDQYGTIKY
jgi:hypothetical protein